MSGRKVTRRVVVLGATTWPLAVESCPTPDWPLWRLFAHADDLVAIGLAARAALGDVPADMLARTLQDRIGVPAGAPARSVAAALTGQIAADGRSEDLVAVGDWMLTRTEALLAATASFVLTAQS